MFYHFLDRPLNTVVKYFKVNYIKYSEMFLYRDEGVHIHIHNMEYEYHTHDFWEFFIVTEGSGRHNLNGVASVVNKNELYLIRPFDQHSFRPLKKDGAAAVSQHLNVMATDGNIAAIAGAISNGLYETLKAGQIPLHCLLDEHALRSFMRTWEIIRALPNGETDKAVALIKILFFEALKYLYYNSVFHNELYPAWLNEFVAKMKRPDNIGLNVDELSRLSNFSHIHLARLFKQFTGETLVDYFVKAKMDYAATLLKTTDIKLLDISSNIGYTSLSHFLRLFKKLYGMTPTEYRRAK